MTHYYTVQEVAEILKVSEQRVRKLIAEGDLLTVKDGKAHKIPDREVYNLVSRRLKK